MSNPHRSPGTQSGGATEHLDERLALYLAKVAERPVLMSWPCRDDYSASLYPLPPGQSRRDLFCGRCTAPTCLFGGTPAQRRLCLSSRTWSIPDSWAIASYITAVQTYGALLRRERTCWYCANLRQLRGERRRFVCIHNTELTRSRPSSRGDLPSLSAAEAKLLTDVEACGSEHYRRRRHRRPVILPAVWVDMLARDGAQARCAYCLHLRSIVVAGRERYLCALEVEDTARPVAWRLARSWRVVQGRRGAEMWCRGSRWCPRLGDVRPLSVAATA